MHRGNIHLDLAARTHWVFDLDGTLTLAVHDFDAIRAELALPVGEPILEAIAAAPPEDAADLYRRLDVIELELAQRSAAQEGAAELLAALRRRGAELGVLTRNSEFVAQWTLRRCGLMDFFRPEHVIGRESAAPKPSPNGILRLLERWGAAPAAAVMVGDFRFDLLAGRRAGVATVYLDVQRRAEWSHYADHSVHDLRELLPLVNAGRPVPGQGASSTHA
ncbi:MAG: HAD family hydrolase [Gammaproteobacteria bacterium]|nr:HAD family hydrolase [Gammaproteobacteria bacterium]NIR82501.1 HAD family hydrolase [Gammaproteobacteria bacterium]NIR88497.1 HAD family hydrolase [Gammaproteobacteria bacterium]NIU03637.1 HAD family hydrolase [Gammaproteobacteria bacterium]NIV50989.1 HAD-IA family hydrolase [Gammaproteobacteria bacterium]